jgi:hypothetical protein
VYYDFPAEKFAQQDKWCIFKETHTVAGYGKIAQRIAMRKQFPESDEICPNETQVFHDRLFANLVDVTRSRQVDKVADEFFVQLFVLLDILTDHCRTMYGWRQGSNEQNALLFH